MATVNVAQPVEMSAVSSEVAVDAHPLSDVQSRKRNVAQSRRVEDAATQQGRPDLTSGKRWIIVVRGCRLWSSGSKPAAVRVSHMHVESTPGSGCSWFGQDVETRDVTSKGFDFGKWSNRVNVMQHGQDEITDSDQ